MKVSYHIQKISAPPFELIYNKVREFGIPHDSIIDMAQAIPRFCGLDLINDFSALLSHNKDRICRYTETKGMKILRHAVSRAIYSDFGFYVDPDSEILITAGANQAFILSILVIQKTFNEFALVSPYFVDHEIAISSIGAKSREIFLDPNSGFQFRSDHVCKQLEGVDAVVITSPNNPTGIVYSYEEMRKFAQCASNQRIPIILDETYAAFIYDKSRHFNPLSDVITKNNSIVIGSLSKTFGISGLRIGYLLANKDFVESAIKVQESTIICAPTISQFIAHYLVSRYGLRPARYIHEMKRRWIVISECMQHIRGIKYHVGNGGFFIFPKFLTNLDSHTLCMRLLEETGILTIPGLYFSKYTDNYLRMSFGALMASEIKTACKKLAWFTSRHTS